MYSHPHGRFVPNVTPIPGQGYVYHPSPGVHPSLHHASPSTLNHPTVAAYPQPQSTATTPSTAGYHPSPPPALPGTLQPQYITPAEIVHPIQASPVSIKIEKSAEDPSLIYQRNQPTDTHKQLNHTHQIITAAPQPTLTIQEADLARQRAEHDAELARQHAAKLLLQQSAEEQQAVEVQEAAVVASQTQKEQQERERREREIQRLKVIEDHQKQKNSNRIFTNSSKNLTDITKVDTVTNSANTVKSVPSASNVLKVCTSPAEHGFRKITAPLVPTNPPKSRSPLPQLDVKLYKCIVCGFLAESAALLGRHAFEMHEKRSRKWKVGQKVPIRHECEECDYETADIHRLHRHMQRVHDTDQVFHFQCKECDFVATSADLLGKHALEMHEAGSIFRCSLCDFVSNRKR